MICMYLLLYFRLDGTSEDLVDMFIVHTIEEIQGLIDAHNQVFKKNRLKTYFSRMSD